jgi:hypothetical protein
MEVRGKTERGAHADVPLGGVKARPVCSTAIVGRELVVEVVVALAEGDDRREQVIPR